MNRGRASEASRLEWLDRAARQPHSRLLLACAGPWQRTETIESVTAVVERGVVDWAAFTEATLRHGVAPIAAAYLARPETEAAVPVQVDACLQRIRAANEARNAALLAETGRVVETLRAAGIRSIVLKGAALAPTVYPEPELRNFADIDILVDPERLRDAEEAIGSLGYAPDRSVIAGSLTHGFSRTTAEDILSGTLAPEFVPTHARFLGPDYCHRIVVELHRGLFRTLDGLWRRDSLEPLWVASTQFSPCAGTQAHMLDPEAMLVHLAAHAGDHAFGRLMFPVDASFVIGAHLDQLAWERVVNLARTYTVADRLHTLLHLAHKVCGAQVPPNVVDGLREEDGRRFHAMPVSGVLAGRSPVGTEVVLRRLLRAHSLRDAAWSAARILWPGRDVIREAYGVKSLPMVALCGMIRPFHLAGRAIRVLASSAAAGRP